MRLLEERHAPESFAVVDSNRAHLRRWLPWLDVNTRVEDSLAFIRSTRKKLADSDAFQAGIWQDDGLVGVIGFHQVQRANRLADIGYWLAEGAQGKGLMTRATRALVTHAFGPMGLNRVEIRAAIENKPSRAIPERLGFELEGTLRDAEWLYDHFVDHAVYGMLARDCH